MIDPYPSRIHRQPEIKERKDPIVYGGADDGPLSPEQLAFYQRNGFLRLQGLFSAGEVEACRRELQRLWSREARGTRDEVIREPASDVIRSIFAVHRDSSLFRRLVNDPRLVAIAEQITASAVYVHQSRINYKRGFNGKEFYWHSDFETWHVEDGMPRMRALSMSLALSENTHDNGPLMLIPGSHRRYVACVGETPAEHYKDSLRRQEYGVPDEDSLERLAREGGIEAAVGPPGSLIVFDCNTMHGSNSNITPSPRSNLFFVYNSVENALCEPFGGTTPRPEWIAHREYTPACPPAHAATA